MNSKLSEEAIEEIKSFYVEIRNRHIGKEGMKPVLICVKDLDNIKKSAQEFAKARNSNIVLKEDARRAIKEWGERNE